MYYKHSRYDGHISLAIKIKKMTFKLNINKSEKEGKGKGPAGFSFNQSKNLYEAFGKHIVGNDIMSDGYYNQVNKVEGIEGGGSGINMNVPGPMYLTDPDEEDNVAIGESKTTTDEVDLGRGRGGKNTRTTTVTPVERVKGEGTPDAARKGVNRLGTETVTKTGSSTKKKTKLGGTSGWRKDKSGYVIEDEVNEIKPRGIQKL